ncbi:MAG TPA: radical SAM family heme chaperone HemW [Acidimicrobiales bacterium]|nr:radical SAM family heme chaperone HemW [Acidimicrobiales bacterium]
MAPTLGAYVHLPFCAERCDYCAFALWTDRGHLTGRYVDAVVREIVWARESGTLWRPSTVYLGGGTPSVVPGALLRRIIEELDPVVGAEVTVECNPESTTEELVSELARGGVTRISLGVQSTSTRALASLGRASEPGAVDRAVEAIARAGIAEYSVDLVYGAAAESDASWRSTLSDVLALDPAPAHISIYSLTIEPGTPLAKSRARHPVEDVLARRYGIADAILADAGYRWYEISNFALAGHESRHNSNYWAQGPYLGFGASAHSHIEGRRFRNVWHIDRYLERVERGVTPLGSEEHLTLEQRRFEGNLLLLRTRRGVPRDALDLDGIEHLVEPEGSRVVLTVEGRMLADAIALHLVDR